MAKKESNGNGATKTRPPQHQARRPGLESEMTPRPRAVKFEYKPADKLEGKAAHCDVVGDSGNVKTHSFCPACGSPVYLTFVAMPDLFTVHAASLDDPARFKPQVVTYGVRGYDWDHLDAALPKFDKMPPANS